MFLKPLILTSLLLTGGGLHAQEKIVLNDNDLQRMVLSQNGIQRDTLLVDAAKARTGFLQRSGEPRLSATLGGEGFQSGSTDTLRIQPVGRLDAVMPLYQNGHEAAEENIRKTDLRLSEIQRHQTMATQLATAQQLYWDIVYTDEMVQNLKEIRTHNQENYASAKRRYQRGLLPKSDLLAFEIYQSHLDTDIESLQHEKKIVMITLKAFLGVSESTHIRVADTRLPHSHDGVATATIQASETTEIAALRVHAEKAAFKRDQSAAKSTPHIDAFGRYALYPENGPVATWLDRTEISAGIQAYFSLYDGQERHAQIQADTLKLQAITTDIAYQKRIVAAEIKAAQEELIHLHELFHHSETRLAQAKHFLKTLTQEYDRGVKDATDVLTALQFYEEVQGHYATQKKQYQHGKSALLAKLSAPL